jgi:3-oxoacyl-[acyl-carrier-protein] synthase III
VNVLIKNKKYSAKITAVGVCVPERVVTNKDLEHLVDTSDHWIRTRTGIAQRHLVNHGECNSDLSARAIKNLLQERGVGADEIDLIIVGTVTPDMFFPSTACVIQEKIGARNAWGFDLSGACSGFLYALAVGAQFVTTRMHKKVVVVGADIMSSIINSHDRATCVLFGDAAGAVLLEPAEEDEVGIIDSILRSDGSGGKYLYMPGGGSMNPATHETIDKQMHVVHQDGRVVFRYAVKGMADVSREILENNGLTAENLALYVPHQANKRIIDASVEKLGLDPAKVIINIDRYANTTAATIPLCLFEANQEKRIRKGDLALLASFGAGWTWGSILLRWEI